MTKQHDHERFLAALANDMPEAERLIVCGFPGDPNAVDKTAWRPRPWKPGTEVPLGWQCNGYVTCASFRRADDRTWRRRGALFAAARGFMVDDVGTKVDWKVLDCLRPTALVETSPANFQAWYLLAEPLRDAAKYDAIIRAFIADKLAADDPGMAGITRVGRLPDFINGKPKYGGDFRVKLHELDPARRYDSGEIVRAFGLELIGKRASLTDAARLLPADIPVRVESFISVRRYLARRGMLKRDAADAGGWTEMTCPWTGDHTNREDNGAAICEPNPNNGFYGGFQCHHGHCTHKTWRDLTDYVDEAAAEENESTNAQAAQEMEN